MIRPLEYSGAPAGRVNSAKTPFFKHDGPKLRLLLGTAKLNGLDQELKNKWTLVAGSPGAIDTSFLGKHNSFHGNEGGDYSAHT